MIEIPDFRERSLAQRLQDQDEYWVLKLSRQEDPPQPSPHRVERPFVALMIWYLPALIRILFGLLQESFETSWRNWPDRILSETRTMEAEMAVCRGEAVVWVPRVEGKAAIRIFRLARAALAREYNVWLYTENPEPQACLPAGIKLPRGAFSAAVLLDLASQMVGAETVYERVEMQPPKPGRLRVMTYNVHACVGMDGRLSPERVARVIARYHPHVVALQELDSGRRRTDYEEQALRLAQLLKMDFHFEAAMETGGGEYGNAILSRLPLRLVKAGPLPHPGGKLVEPRGAIWVEVDFEGIPVQLINAHLGLLPNERLAQIRALLGPDWAGRASRPLVLLGDFNAGPTTLEYRLLSSKLRDAQPKNPRKTWSSRYPVRLLDYIFCDGDLNLARVSVPRTRLTAEASDHLPIIVDLEF